VCGIDNFVQGKEGREGGPAFRSIVMDTSPEPAPDRELQIEPEAVEVQQEQESAKQILLHDSMVTVRLSEPPPALTVDTSANIVRRDRKDTIGEEGIQDVVRNKETAEEESPRITMMDPNGEELSPTGSESASERNPESRRGSDSSEASVEGGGVNWEELEKTEEKEPRSESSDDVSNPPSLSRLFADVSVYGLTARETRSGEQPPSHKSEVRNRKGADYREAE
jgi:hypothetical protein